MPSWRNGILPVHQNFHSIQASAAHTDFHDNALESAAAHEILSGTGTTASFIVSGLPAGSQINGYVSGQKTETITVIPLSNGNFTVYVSGEPTAGDVLTLQIKNSTGILLTVSYTVTSSDTISTIVTQLYNLIVSNLYTLVTAVNPTPLQGNLLVTANPGDTSIQVSNASAFTVGQYAIIDPGHSDQQELWIIGYLSPTTLLLGGSILRVFPAGEFVIQTTVNVILNNTPPDSGPGTPQNNSNPGDAAPTTVAGGGANNKPANNVGVRFGGNGGGFATLSCGLKWDDKYGTFLSWHDCCGENQLQNKAFWLVRPNSYIPYNDLNAHGFVQGELIPGGGGAHYGMEGLGTVDPTSGKSFWSGDNNFNSRKKFTSALNLANPDLMTLWYSTASSAWAMMDAIPGNNCITVDKSFELWNTGYQPDNWDFGVNQVLSYQNAMYTEPVDQAFGQNPGGGKTWRLDQEYHAVQAWHPHGIVASTAWLSNGPLFIYTDASKDTSTADSNFAGTMHTISNFGASSLGIGASRAMAVSLNATTTGYLFVGTSSGVTPPAIYAFDAPLDTALFSTICSGATSTPIQVLPISGGSTQAVPATQTFQSAAFVAPGPVFYTQLVLPVGYVYMSGAPSGSQFQLDANGSWDIINGANFGIGGGVYLGTGPWTVTATLNPTTFPCITILANGDVYYCHMITGHAQKLSVPASTWGAVDSTGTYLYLIPLPVVPGTNDGNTYATGASSINVYQMDGAATNKKTISLNNLGTITPSLYSSGTRNKCVYNVLCAPLTPKVALQCSNDVLILPTGQTDAGITQ